MRKSHFHDEFLVLLWPIISWFFACSNEVKINQNNKGYLYGMIVLFHQPQESTKYFSLPPNNSVTQPFLSTTSSQRKFIMGTYLQLMNLCRVVLIILWDIIYFLNFVTISQRVCPRESLLGYSVVSRQCLKPKPKFSVGQRIMLHLGKH